MSDTSMRLTTAMRCRGGVMKLTDERGTRIATLETGSDFLSAGTPWHTVLNVGDTTVQYLIIESR